MRLISRLKPGLQGKEEVMPGQSDPPVATGADAEALNNARLMVVMTIRAHCDDSIHDLFQGLVEAMEVSGTGGVPFRLVEPDQRQSSGECPEERSSCL